jgi:GTP cyclohydrolase II
MGIIKKLIGFVFGRNPIVHSRVTSLSTRYGMYNVKAYKDVEQEYLAIMSRNFFKVSSPIVYLHSDYHLCDPNDDNSCHCNNQMDMALKMIYKEGGVVMYHSQDGRNIDGLLSEMNARKIEGEKNAMTKTNANLGLTAFERKYHTLGFILKDLNLSTMKLVSNDPKAVDIVRQLEIDITKHVPAITFGYGKQ